MRPFRLKPLGVALLCLFPAGAHADDVRLRLQPELLPIPRHTTDPLPLFIEADKMQGHQDKETEAEGNARLRRRGKLIFADWLRHSKQDDQVDAVGNVRIEQFGDIVEGPRLNFNLATERGIMDEPKFTMPSAGGRGTACPQGT